MFKKLLFSTLLCAAALSGFSQNVNIPDANFKAELLSNPTINTNGDSEIQFTEANNYTGSILVSSDNIFDLTGIEAFTEITVLVARNNNISSVDLSQNLALVDLDIAQNSLTNLDLTQNTALEQLVCWSNQLTALDLSQNVALTNLNCPLNMISSLDLSQNTMLQVLNFRGNNISSLDVSQNVLLRTILTDNNPLTTLDVTQNTLLERIWIVNNAFTELDLSNNLELTELLCSGSLLSNVDLSQHSNVVFVSSSNCPQLTTLNIANGNNLNFAGFEATNNPNLSCIEVDSNIDLNNPPSDWEKDDDTQYSYDCDNLSVDDTTLNIVSVYPNPFSSKLIVDSLEDTAKIKIYNVLGKLVLETNAKSIDTRKLSSGLYILNIETAQGSVSKKLIKQ